MVGRHWPEDTGFLWALLCASSPSPTGIHGRGSWSTSLGFVRAFVNGKVLLLLVMLNPHKVMAKPHQYYRRGATHLLFRHFFSSKGVHMQEMVLYNGLIWAT